ncbi:MAG: adenosylmethionine--8-amino-7-oxononanoate transaminase [Bacteroidia bacterium]
MSISSRDTNCIWHPYTQMQSAPPPVAIVKAKGAKLWSESGICYIDGIASWWTNIHGHGNESIVKAIATQASVLDHLIFAGFTHEPAVKLAERLLEILPSEQSRVFYSDNGSTAVEVALKMAFQFWTNRGQPRKKIIALHESYHGDTFGAMAVSGRGAFTKPFETFLFDVIYIDAPLRGFKDKCLHELRKVISDTKNEIAAFIYEPLVQGTAGMRMMDPGLLEEMISLCKSNEILCIADEVMTGFGRTGKMFAGDYLSVQPDLICLSKGLTGGVMALGVTSCSLKIYEAFLSDDRMKTFFHGHSFTANPIACAAAIASLELFETENTFEKIQSISAAHTAFAESVKHMPGVKEVRVLGVILALEIQTDTSSSYFNPVASRAYSYFMEQGILLRPLGNIIYILPPYCIQQADLEYIYQTIKAFINSEQ